MHDRIKIELLHKNYSLLSLKRNNRMNNGEMSINKIKVNLLGTREFLLGFYSIILKESKSNILNYFLNSFLIDINKLKLIKDGLIDQKEKPYYRSTIFSAAFSNNNRTNTILNKKDSMPLPFIWYTKEDKEIIGTNKDHNLDDEYGYYYFHALRSCLLKKLDEIEEWMIKLIDIKKNMGTRWPEYNNHIIIFLQGILESNNDKINNSISIINKSMSILDVTTRLPYSPVCSGFAKLALIHRFEIDYDKYNIPKVLMSLEPLPEYKTYNWIEDLYDLGYEEFERKYSKKN